jgi:hypothetical protein
MWLPSFINFVIITKHHICLLESLPLSAMGQAYIQSNVHYIIIIILVIIMHIFSTLKDKCSLQIKPFISFMCKCAPIYYRESVQVNSPSCSLLSFCDLFPLPLVPILSAVWSNNCLLIRSSSKVSSPLKFHYLYVNFCIFHSCLDFYSAISLLVIPGYSKHLFFPLDGVQ